MIEKIYMELKVIQVQVGYELPIDSLSGHRIKKGEEIILYLSETPEDSKSAGYKITCCEAFHLKTPDTCNSESFTAYFDTTKNEGLSYSEKRSNKDKCSEQGIEILSNFFGNPTINGKVLLIKNPLKPWVTAYVTISAIPFFIPEPARKIHHADGDTSMHHSINMNKFGKLVL